MEALESINKYAQLDHEVIVVDNASSDQTVEELAPKFPQVKFIANRHNIGFSAANNQGVRHSKGNLLLFLNPDAKLLDNRIEEALRSAQSHSEFIIGPRILNPDNSLQESVINIPTAGEVIKEALFLTYLSRNNMVSVLEKNQFALSGACLLMPRSLFDKLGGFDENLFWMDDVDLCYRARIQNAFIAYFPGWEVMHVIGVSSKKNYNKVIANQFISKLKFFKKNKRWAEFFISIPFIQLQVLLRILLFVIAAPFNETAGKKLCAYIYAQRALWAYLFTGDNRVY